MTIETVHYINVVLGLGAIFVQALSLYILVLFFVNRKKKDKVLVFVKDKSAWFGFLLGLGATILSLFYSVIVGFLPCSLCWYQRIFMFPLPILFTVALYYKENIYKYVAPMTLVGFSIALYQSYFYYFGESSTLPCDASGISCYQRLISELGGYISFPMFGLTIFFALLVLSLVTLFYKGGIQTENVSQS